MCNEGYGRYIKGNLGSKGCAGIPQSSEIFQTWGKRQLVAGYGREVGNFVLWLLCSHDPAVERGE